MPRHCPPSCNFWLQRGEDIKLIITEIISYNYDMNAGAIRVFKKGVLALEADV